MVYTITGAFLGGIITLVLAKVFDVDFKGNRFFPGNGQILVMLGSLARGGMGMGYGYALLMNGTHVYNKIIDSL